MGIGKKLQNALNKDHSTEQDEREAAFQRSLGIKHLLFLLPFLIAAAVFLLMSLR